LALIFDFEGLKLQAARKFTFAQPYSVNRKFRLKTKHY